VATNIIISMFYSNVICQISSKSDFSPLRGSKWRF